MGTVIRKPTTLWPPGLIDLDARIDALVKLHQGESIVKCLRLRPIGLVYYNLLSFVHDLGGSMLRMHFACLVEADGSVISLHVSLIFVTLYHT